uniref:CUE domain-containing protein n=1 Tax=Caenorhabditis tropicalis TaxID=1561998 RepID=A0A1I7T422_9PELO
MQTMVGNEFNDNIYKLLDDLEDKEDTDIQQDDEVEQAVTALSMLFPGNLLQILSIGNLSTKINRNIESSEAFFEMMMLRELLPYVVEDRATLEAQHLEKPFAQTWKTTCWKSSISYVKRITWTSRFFIRLDTGFEKLSECYKILTYENRRVRSKIVRDAADAEIGNIKRFGRLMSIDKKDVPRVDRQITSHTTCLCPALFTY